MNKRFLMEAALRIRNEPAFSDLREWLDVEQKQALNVLTGARDDRAMYAAQGAYAAIEKLKKLIEDAPGVLDQLSRGNPHP